MKIHPDQLKEFADDIEGLEQDYQSLVDAEPEIKKYLDRAKDYARIRYEHVASPLPANPARL